jgi:hypothetical protein
MKAFVRRGLTATVGVLALLGALLTAYAFWILPDTALPKPQSSDIQINFNPGHPATSPIRATLSLLRGDHYSEGTSRGIVLEIDVTGPDLAHTGWSMFMIMPAGVQIVPDYLTLRNPSAERVIPHGWFNTQDTVVINPGPQAAESYSVALSWNDLHSGPMQIDGANLAAWLPDVEVNNYAPGNSNGSTPTVPQPKLSVVRGLEPGGDFTYVGGQAPDQSGSFSDWVWNAAPAIITNGGSGVISAGPYVEARSAFADQQSGNAVFKSGIAFGVAAAALIAAIQEFIKSATDDRRYSRDQSL